jgi:tripartite-type tricarboxylate transporter receptor subunit TctC
MLGSERLHGNVIAVTGGGQRLGAAIVRLAAQAGMRVALQYHRSQVAAQDLVAGQVPMMVDTATETIEHHRAGRVRIVAVTGDQRSKSLPDVPTLTESGINVVADGFLGLYGPATVPAETVARIDRAVAESLKTSEMQEKVYSFGLVPNYASSAQLSNAQAVQYRRWEAPIKTSGFKVE